MSDGLDMGKCEIVRAPIKAREKARFNHYKDENIRQNSAKINWSREKRVKIF